MTPYEHQLLVEKYHNEHHTSAHPDGGGPVSDPEFARELAELFVDLLADTKPFGIDGLMVTCVHTLLLAAGQRASVIDSLRVLAEDEAARAAAA